ncbi:hypothetical protein RJ639_042145 [Escallonia herrerae]|uniref:Reverse transcriptase Ty1/copia-type domain-containing protein n=1 Tax=Escallonia herrerae TaxID=1293975 RepID=A0AA88WIW3_9ASTE|nr:hypothetical protein RJ639_042145 [Escallonia herrerae]
MINTEFSGLNHENLDPKSISLPHDIDGNKNEGTQGTKELLVYSRKKQIQGNKTDASYVEIPKIVQDALQVPERKEAILKEMRDFEKNETWEVMDPLPFDGKITILIVHADEIILTGDDIAEIERLKQCLASEFEIKDLGSLMFFLRMEIARSKKGIVVSQRKYAIDLLKETGTSWCHPAEIPMDLNQKLGDNKEIHLPHPEILKKFSRKGLFFKKNEQRNLGAYTDVDWAGSITDRKSPSGYCTFVWETLVTWKSRKQSVMVHSSAKAEYRGTTHGICEMILSIEEIDATKGLIDYDIPNTHVRDEPRVDDVCDLSQCDNEVRTPRENEDYENFDSQQKDGKTFDTLEAAYEFYNRYALLNDFGTRKHNAHKIRVTGAIFRRQFVCNKEGFKKLDDKRPNVNEKRCRDFRTGCEAMMQVTLSKKLGAWVVDKFQDIHHHPLTTTPSKAIKHRSHSKYHRTNIEIQCIIPKTKLRNGKWNGTNSYKEDGNVDYDDMDNKSDASDSTVTKSVGSSSSNRVCGPGEPGSRVFSSTFS